MKYLKLFESHITEGEVAKICNKFKIKNWSLNSDGSVDVNGSVWINNNDLLSIPLKFGRIEHDFNCDENKLTSLKGSPKYVGVHFNCTENKLTSLEGSPKYIKGDFDCRWNNIKSFEGIGIIGGNFYCEGNPIWSLYHLFIDHSKIEMFNEWEIIQGDNVYLYRLNDFLETIGIPEVNKNQLNDIKMHYNVL